VILVLLMFVAAILLTIVALALVRGGTATTTTTTISPKNMIVVTASGTATNTTTQASLYVIINGTGATNQQAVQNVSNTLTIFNSTIFRFLNGNMSNVATTYFNVYKIYNKSRYIASESVSVILPNINNVSNAVNSLSAIPNVYVTYATPQLSPAQINIMRPQALSLAMLNATAQANAVLGNAYTITATNITINAYYSYPYPIRGGACSADLCTAINNKASNIGPQFFGGQGKVTQSVTVVFYYSKK